MEKSKINIWNPSGCLSREATMTWLKKELSVSETALVEKHLKECLLCREALEGLSRLSPQKANREFALLSDRFNQNINKGNRISRTLIISLAAAVILAFIGIFSILNWKSPQNSMPIAQQVTKQVPPQSNSKIQEPEMETQVLSRTYDSVIEEKPKLKASKKNKVAETVVLNDEKEEPVTEVQSADEALIAEVPELKKEEQAQAGDNLSAGMAQAAPERKKAMRMEEVRYADKAMSSAKKEDETTFYVTEQPPVFQGGDITTYKNYIENKLIEPIQHKEISTGKIITVFTIDAQGKMKDIVVVRGLNAKTDSAVISIMKNSPAWQPARQRGKPVNINMTLPLNVGIH